MLLIFDSRGVATAGDKWDVSPMCSTMYPVVNFKGVCVPFIWAYFGVLCPVCSMIWPKNSNSSSIPFTVNEDSPLAPTFNFDTDGAVVCSQWRLMSLSAPPKQKTWLCPFLRAGVKWAMPLVSEVWSWRKKSSLRLTFLSASFFISSSLAAKIFVHKNIPLVPRCFLLQQIKMMVRTGNWLIQVLLL